jgi:hypothetical protein
MGRLLVDCISGVARHKKQADFPLKGDSLMCRQDPGKVETNSIEDNFNDSKDR